jgi:anti-anti-sigma factor
VAAVEAPQYPQFSVCVVPARREVVVVPEGELDLACVDVLAAEVDQLRGAGFAHLVIDLRRLVFIDSSGLHLLLQLRGDAERDGHTLKLVPGPPAVQRTFDLTGTRRLFAWRDY